MARRRARWRRNAKAALAANVTRRHRARGLHKGCAPVGMRIPELHVVDGERHIERTGLSRNRHAADRRAQRASRHTTHADAAAAVAPTDTEVAPRARRSTSRSRSRRAPRSGSAVARLQERRTARWRWRESIHVADRLRRWRRYTSAGVRLLREIGTEQKAQLESVRPARHWNAHGHEHSSSAVATTASSSTIEHAGVRPLEDLVVNLVFDLERQCETPPLHDRTRPGSPMRHACRSRSALATVHGTLAAPVHAARQVPAGDEALAHLRIADEAVSPSQPRIEPAHHLVPVRAHRSSRFAHVKIASRVRGTCAFHDQRLADRRDPQGVRA